MKRYLQRLFVLLASWLMAWPLFSQAPKREFRGVWIATVKNIDWPSDPRAFSEEQKSELRDIIEYHHQNGMNAIIFQIRPAADAFYESRFEPWSQWLTGKQGISPHPKYDPLAFAIEEAHARGMALHAWINPYRAAIDWDSTSMLAPNHISRIRPDWFLKYGKNLYFDPGNPEARRYVTEVVMDVVNRYDIDAIHFDDYFYPYQIQGEVFPDYLTFQTYGKNFNNIDDWRRNNVSEFIHMLRDSMLIYKPEVLFGISPFGVWRNQSVDPEGSATRAGQTSYDHLYADILLWLEKGWIDYVAPQLYWSIGYSPAAFDVLIQWWNERSFGRHVYIGHGIYKVGDNQDQNWFQPSQIPKQIRLTRTMNNVGGSIYFSSRQFEKNALGVTDSLNHHYYKYPALLPDIRWVDDEAPKPMFEGVDIASEKRGLTLNWPQPKEEENAAKYYAIYKAKGKEKPEILPENLVKIIGADQAVFLDTDTRFLRRYTYTFTSLDRFHNESAPGVSTSKIRWSGFLLNRPKKKKDKKAKRKPKG